MIFRSENYICAQSTFSAKLSLAHKELLYEVPSLRVILFAWGAKCASIGDLAILGSIGARRGHFSAKFHHFQIFHLHHDDLALTKTCRKQSFHDLSPIQSCSPLKVVQGSWKVTQIHPQDHEQFQFFYSNVISVSSPLFVQNCL